MVQHMAPSVDISGNALKDLFHDLVRWKPMILERQRQLDDNAVEAEQARVDSALAIVDTLATRASSSLEPTHAAAWSSVTLMHALTAVDLLKRRADLDLMINRCAKLMPSWLACQVIDQLVNNKICPSASTVCRAKVSSTLR